MEMTSTRVVNAPPDKVWTALNDPAVLKDAVPGCESFERVTDTEWRVVVAAKVGPVAARFNGRITLADLDPPTAYTLKFEGQGGAAGKMADEFFARFAERVAPSTPEPVSADAAMAAGSAENTAPAEAVRNPTMRYVALAALAVIIAWLAIRGFRF